MSPDKPGGQTGKKDLDQTTCFPALTQWYSNQSREWRLRAYEILVVIIRVRVIRASNDSMSY